MAAEEAVKNKKETINEQNSAGEKREVELMLYAPRAQKVFIAGTFNNWDTKAMPLIKDDNGVWRIKTSIAPGKHEYKYFVDGEWDQYTPATECVDNVFGTKNCVMKIQ